MTAIDLFKQGKLEDAIQATIEVVRNNPSDISARSSLCEFQCFAGNLEKADKQLDTLLSLDADALHGVSMFRQLIRAEQARNDFYRDGALPDFIEQPGDELKARLEASIAIREGHADDAVARLAEAESARTVVTGTCNGENFSDLRDLDDLLGSVVEVLTSTGKYYWVSLNQIRSLTFDPIEHTRDLLWRPMEIEVGGDIDGRVYAPALYHGSFEGDDPKSHVGLATDWTESIAGVIRGVGQKMFLVGEDAVPGLEITELRINE